MIIYWSSSSIRNASFWPWSVNIHLIIANNTSTWPAASVNTINRYISIGSPSYVRPTWAAVISSSIIHISIVYNSSVVNVYIITSIIIAWIIITIYRSLWNKVPAISGKCVPTTKAYVNINAWTHWRPAIISATTSPIYPGWAPSCSWQPKPLSIVVVYPTSVMKGCPSPVIIRDPSISIFCHCPPALRIIRSKAVLVYIRPPNIAILWILNPSTVGRKFVVKSL